MTETMIGIDPSGRFFHLHRATMQVNGQFGSKSIRASLRTSMAASAAVVFEAREGATFWRGRGQHAVTRVGSSPRSMFGRS